MTFDSCSQQSYHILSEKTRASYAMFALRKILFVLQQGLTLTNISYRQISSLICKVTKAERQ